MRHTHEVLENLQDLLISMQSVESGYRGFALTGSEKYSESFHADILRWQQDLTALRNLIEDNPTQQRQFLTLERLANQKFEFGETVISLCQTKGLAAAADSIRSGPGQRIMDDFQGAIRGLQDEELRLLVLRNADAKRRLGQTKIVLILGTVLFLLIAAAAGWSVQRDTSGRGLTEEALRDSEERYRMLLDGVQDYATYILDPQGQVVSWNAGAERIKGYTAEQIIGHNFSCFFPPEDIERGRPVEVLRMTAASGRREEEGMRVRKGARPSHAQLHRRRRCLHGHLGKSHLPQSRRGKNDGLVSARSGRPAHGRSFPNPGRHESPNHAESDGDGRSAKPNRAPACELYPHPP